ncbi:MAG: response regulator [Desulfobacula sp.]|uniref:response regulator n=1 Tax=Desulfobacula sp. TaxID=2593537 RepID=UPI0025C300FD|nr:response regulator [Desulfobacula sp.]MCD4720229.1 response regulator [Desulfobacula sp.]
MKILIAEDDLTSRRILEAILTKWGYDVICVSNGDDAIDRLLDADAPKLVLLDWIMPDKDGIEVCRIVRQEETTTPPYIILLTGKGDKKDIAKGLDSGANDYIVKPYDKDELQARINVGQRMVELQNALAEKEKFQGVLEMAGAVCHEFNQPLMVISGYSEMLLMDISEDNPQYETVERINEQVHCLGEITKKLMRVAKYRTKSYLKGNIVDISEASQG